MSDSHVIGYMLNICTKDDTIQKHESRISRKYLRAMTYDLAHN